MLTRKSCQEQTHENNNYWRKNNNFRIKNWCHNQDANLYHTVQDLMIAFLHINMVIFLLSRCNFLKHINFNHNHGGHYLR